VGKNKDTATLDLFAEAPPLAPKENDPRICGRWVGWSHVKELFEVRFTWRNVEKILVERDGVPVDFENLDFSLQQKILAEQESDFVDLAAAPSGQGPAEDELPKCFCGKGVRMWIQTAAVEGGFCSEECYDVERKRLSLLS
jgi:hypothetical protein